MMMRRAIAYAALVVALVVGFLPRSHAWVTTPSTTFMLNQPDKALFDRALEALKKNRYAEARALLENLIDSYRDSDYVPRAKLAIGDAWYAEGVFKRAEMEYQDFITFFPNRPEVAEAKRKIESIRKKAKM
jgi:outer membrane protein assembly factor BamD